MPILACFEFSFEFFFEFFFRIREISRDYHPPHTMQTMDTPPSTPPHRPKGGEVSVGRRYAIVVEAALAIPPGQVRTPTETFLPASVLVLLWAPQVSWF